MMVSFKGILKYLIYIFIAAWMFLLGIVVGRGTSPVTFDTKKFQERLEFIAKEHGKENYQEKKEVDLEFFGELKHPIPIEGSNRAKNSTEIIPKKETPVPEISEEGIPMKLSRKTLTDRRHLIKDKPQKTAQVKIAKSVKPASKVKQTANVAEPSDTKNGKYTIQIAAHKEFKDAVTQMAQLEKKGFTTYREKSNVKGETWYRVRIGSFSTLSQAKEFNERLKKARIKTLIIKK